MGKTNLTQVAKNIGVVLRRHSPEILVGVGIAGMVTTTVLAVRATPKALILLEDAKKKKLEDENTEKLSPIEVVKETWKCYIPAAVTCVASAACIIGASSVHVRRNAALATAYKLSETALTDYKEKVIDTFGEKKEKAVREKIAEDKLKEKPASKAQVLVTDIGNTLCYDVISSRYFRSDINTIRKVENEMNRELLYNMYISVNEFYDKLNLPHISVGDDLGWNVDDGLIEFDFSSLLADDGTPCLVISYSIAPRYGYSKLV